MSGVRCQVSGVSSGRPRRYDEAGGKSRLARLGRALIIQSGRAASESEVALLAAFPRRGPGSSPCRNLWRRWPHTSLGDTGPWEQRPPACTNRATKCRGKYRSQSDGDIVILENRIQNQSIVKILWYIYTVIHSNSGIKIKLLDPIGSQYIRGFEIPDPDITRYH